MKLKVKTMNWSAGRPVSVIHRAAAERLGLTTNDRIELSYNSSKISSVIDIADKLLEKDEIIISTEITEIIKLKEGSFVEVSYAHKPFSNKLIKRKLDGEKLSKEEYKQIISDIVNNSLTEVELAFFVTAVYKSKLSFDEIIYLIDAITSTGDQLHFKEKIVADKHCIGGIAGNRTTPLVVSICSASGIIMPKTSSRAITSAAGTADTIEILAKVSFKANEAEKIINKVGACMIWGGSLNLAPADDKLIKVERLLNLDPESQLLASIMSKKIAMGSKYILIDIPYGSSAKVKTLQKAKELSVKFNKIAKRFNLKLETVATDGSQPIGNGVGPVLEMIDILKILRRKEDAPKDLEDKAIFLSGKILEMTGKSKKGGGELLAKEILDSGKAYNKFKEIIEAQDGKIRELSPGPLRKDILSKKSGKIIFIDNKLTNSLARYAGCPADESSGVYLYKKVNDKVSKGEKVLTVYAETDNKIKEALDFFEKFPCFEVK